MYELRKINGALVWFAYKPGSARIESPTFDHADDCKEYVDGLNDALILREYWPDAHDAEVQALLTDSDFYPIVNGNTWDKESSPLWRIHKACEEIARKRAGV